jgi:hypothetical protein
MRKRSNKKEVGELNEGDWMQSKKGLIFLIPAILLNACINFVMQTMFAIRQICKTALLMIQNATQNLFSFSYIRSALVQGTIPSTSTLSPAFCSYLQLE